MGIILQDDRYVEVTANTTLLNDTNYWVNGSEPISLTLPPTLSGQSQIVNNSSEVVTVVGGANAIEGESDATLASGAIAIVRAGSTDWEMVAIGVGGNSAPLDPPGSEPFSYTGAIQGFTVPNRVGGTLAVKIWGAGGAGSFGRTGGGGGYTFVEYAILASGSSAGVGQVVSGDSLNVVVGGGGTYGAATVGVFGGGASSIDAGQGGDYSGIFLGSISLANSLGIAGGGGGAGNSNNSNSTFGRGGVGGGVTGGDSIAPTSEAYMGRGGTQTTGGERAPGVSVDAGSALLGGSTVAGNTYEGGGGGAGKYGGSAGSGSSFQVNPGGGGGGSGDVAGGSNATTSNATGVTPPQSSDPDYPAGIGIGGAATQNGGNGYVFISWS